MSQAGIGLSARSSCLDLGLQGIARTISNYASTQRALVPTIKAVESGPLFELKEKTGLKERYLRYVIALLRARGMVNTEHGEVYRCRLAPDAYAQARRGPRTQI